MLSIFRIDNNIKKYLNVILIYVINGITYTG